MNRMCFKCDKEIKHDDISIIYSYAGFEVANNMLLGNFHYDYKSLYFHKECIKDKVMI